MRLQDLQTPAQELLRALHGFPDYTNPQHAKRLRRFNDETIDKATQLLQEHQLVETRHDEARITTKGRNLVLSGKNTKIADSTNEANARRPQRQISDLKSKKLHGNNPQPSQPPFQARSLDGLPEFETVNPDHIRRNVRISGEDSWTTIWATSDQDAAQALALARLRQDPDEPTPRKVNVEVARLDPMSVTQTITVHARL